MINNNEIKTQYYQLLSDHPVAQHTSPATETNALCSAVPPLVTMRSV